MRIRTIAALAYALLAVIFVFTYESEALNEDGWLTNAYVGVALLAHPVVGFLVPRWWALFLPFVALVVSLPTSEPDPEFFGVTDAGVMFVGGFIAMILIAFGIGCRLTLNMLREPR